MLTAQVSGIFQRRFPSGATLHIEDIQDQVELALMRSGEHQVARSYIIYREARAQQRSERQGASGDGQRRDIEVIWPDGHRAPLDIGRIHTLTTEACAGLLDVDADRIIEETLPNLYDGISADGVATAHW